jgi:MATE family multidrug resistance protein
MDAAGPRRFSVNTALLPKVADDVPGRKPSYAAAPSETDALLGTLVEGEIEEATTIGKEARLLFKYSFPLTLTYLLQVCRNSIKCWRARC